MVYDQCSKGPNISVLKIIICSNKQHHKITETKRIDNILLLFIQELKLVILKYKFKCTNIVFWYSTLCANDTVNITFFVKVHTLLLLMVSISKILILKLQNQRLQLKNYGLNMYPKIIIQDEKKYLNGENVCINFIAKKREVMFIALFLILF